MLNLLQDKPFAMQGLCNIKTDCMRFVKHWKSPAGQPAASGVQQEAQ
jgi:hypothetical protein